MEELPPELAPRWERRAPGRFSYELQDIASVVGDALRVDEDALTKGALILEFNWPLGQELVPLRAIYPDSFPRTRPIVLMGSDPANYPKRHCSPIDGTLCLLGRDTSQWPNQWTLAELLRKQLADALRGTGEEDEQGEPAEYWWNVLGLAQSYCLVDSQWSLNGATGGMLKLRGGFRTKGDVPAIQAYVSEVRNDKNELICSWQGAVPPIFANAATELSVPWLYLDEILLPTAAKGDKLMSLMGQLAPKPRLMDFSFTTSAQLFAVAYHSELAHRHTGLAWLFAVYHGPKQQSSPKRIHRLPQRRLDIVPTYRAGDLDLGARVPAVGMLRNKRVAVVGLGALGAPVALELARAGCGKLHVMDHDTIEPGNSIRWPLGSSAWGFKKTESLAAFIEREYPWTKVHACSHAVGQLDAEAPDQGDERVLDAVLSQVDLVVDASASQGVLNTLVDFCRERSLPIISLYASPPVHGGVVVRFSPQSGCPTCLEFAHHDGAIHRAPGFGDHTSLQQPPGCAERTFSGASFDLQELSMQAVRLIVQTLQSPQAASGSLVQTLSLVDEHGARIPPSWRESALSKAPACSCNRQNL